jgi:hypothetical protein
MKTFPLGNSTGEGLFSNLELNVADNLTTISTMWADFTNASYASSGQLENYVSGGSYSSDSGSPPVPCLRTGDQVLAQLNFYKVGHTNLQNCSHIFFGFVPFIGSCSLHQCLKNPAELP